VARGQSRLFARVPAVVLHQRLAASLADDQFVRFVETFV